MASDRSDGRFLGGTGGAFALAGTIGQGLTLLLAVGTAALLAVVASADARPQADVQPAPGAADACAEQVFNLQQCIDTAALASLRTNTTAPLAAVTAALRTTLRTDTGNALYYRSYSLAYADYRTAQVALAERQPAPARAAALEGERILDGIAIKNQESYALQSLLVYEQFAILPKTEMGVLIGKSLDLRGKLADAAAVRALYARALSDWNTPKEYGGRQVAEKLLRQALAAPIEPANPLKPTWGRDDCASLLVTILNASDRAEEARGLRDSWNKRQPNSIAFAVAPGL